MKTFYISTIFLFSISFIYSQEIKSTLSGSTANEGFSIINSEDKTLLRVRGDGSVGIGTATPNGMFDIIGDTLLTGEGKSINIYAQSTDDPLGDGGSINIISGDSRGSNGTSGDINILTSGIGGATTYSGDINIKTGTSEGEGGDITISTGFGQGSSGKLTLSTSPAEDFSGNIDITTGYAYTGNGGDINILTGSNGQVNGQAGTITLNCGFTESNNDGANIELKAGDSNGVPGNGGNIIITPGNSLNGVNGLVLINGSGTYSGTWTQSSDERFKKNIEPIQFPLEKLEMLTGITYEFNKTNFLEKNFPDGKKIGLIAQEVEKVFPELVTTDNDGYKSVAYQNMVAVLIEAIKEQQKTINDLSKRMEILEKESVATDYSSLDN